MDNFTHVTLLSNSSLKYYPKNSLSKFTVKLPNTIYLNSNEKWHVGLTSVTHTSISAKLPEITPKIRIKVPEKLGWTNENLIDLLNTAPKFYEELKKNGFFDRYQGKTVIRQFTYIKNDNKPYIQLKVLEKVNVILLCNEEYTAEEFFDVIFSQIEKVKWPEFIKSIKNDVKNFKLTTEKQSKIKQLKEKYMEEILITRDIPFPLYICFYCDIIKPQIIGDTSVKSLYMYPLGAVKDKSTPRSYTIDNIQYCPIEKHSISEISILISDEHGEQVNFEDGLFMTCLVLHFRKGI